MKYEVLIDRIHKREEALYGEKSDNPAIIHSVTWTSPAGEKFIIGWYSCSVSTIVCEEDAQVPVPFAYDPNNDELAVFLPADSSEVLEAYLNN